MNLEIPDSAARHLQGVLRSHLGFLDDSLLVEQRALDSQRSPEWRAAELRIKNIEESIRLFEEEKNCITDLLARLNAAAKQLKVPAGTPTVTPESPTPEATTPSPRRKSPSNPAAAPLPLESLHAAVPRNQWIAMKDLAAALGTTRKQILAAIADPACLVWAVGKGRGRIVWRPTRAPKIWRSEKPARSPKPDPTGQAPRMGSSKERLDPAEFDVPPMHKKAVDIGKTLIDPWTATDLMARLGGDMGRSQMWIISWLEIAWIEPSGFGLYRKTKTFGGA